MTLDEMKKKFIKGELQFGLYSADDKIVNVNSNGFTIQTLQDNGWYRVNIYEFIDNEWIYSETYEKA